MAKDKTPNKTLRIAIDMPCSVKDCTNHGTVSRTEAGIVTRKCLEHVGFTGREGANDYLLKFLNLI